MKVRHPSNGRTRTIEPDRREIYESQGWVEVEQAKPAKKAEKPADDKGE